MYAPTFAANRSSLKNFGLEDQVKELNRKLMQICREGVGDTALIAGDLTTTGKMVPQGDLTYDQLIEIYREQAQSLAEAGADLLVAETMLNVDETMAILDAASSVCDLPVMCSLTLESDGTALYGGNAVEAVTTLQEMGACAVGLNCSVGAGSAGSGGCQYEAGGAGSGDRQTERGNAGDQRQRRGGL